MQINPNIFRAYDIRGVYKKDFDEVLFYRLGQTLAAYLNHIQKSPESGRAAVLVGRDVRLSSESLADSLIEGVLDFGFDVLDIGQATTPMFAFGAVKKRAFGGAMITASHNPPEFNGLKLLKAKSQRANDWIGDRELKEVYKMLVEEKYLSGKTKTKGMCQKINIADDYIKFIARDFKIKRTLKIVVDASGGTTALFLPKFLEKLGIEYIPLFFEIDGSFSKHSPNPSFEESQKFTKEKIIETKADFGIIFDGDGDRMVIIDENSNRLRGDAVGGVIADSFLKKGDLMLYDTISTRAIKEYFEKRGIKTARSKVGHYYIKQAMEQDGADFALEMSAHYYFKMMHYVESAFYALRLLLEAMDKNPDSKISDLVKPFLKYNGSGVMDFLLKSKKKWREILESVKNKYKDGQQSFEDGILVEYKDWWFNLRPSNTEPIMRLVIEAKTKNLLDQKQKEILSLLA